jgi:hypothetical protein
MKALPTVMDQKSAGAVGAKRYLQRGEGRGEGRGERGEGRERGTS